MRISITTILLTISLTVSGQGKSLLGKYTHSYPWYEYFLTLGDSGKFIIEEHSDSGLRKTTGTWTINDRLIKLIPAKCISDWGNPSGEIEETPLSYLEKESFISVDKKNNLTRLASKKKPDWWADSIKYNIPDYKLTKVLLTALGQDKSLAGTYSDTLSTHKLILILRDNGEFQADESVDEGKRTLIGRWTFRDNTITLKTIKILAWDKKTPNEKKEFTPKDFPDTFVSVDKNKQLTLLAPKNTEGLNTRLKRIK